MLNFSRSTFTWTGHPWSEDAYYRFPGGFVGKAGQVYHVRFNLEARCEIRDDATQKVSELFLGAPCRSEYTIASRNLFQIPSGEWRMAFSHDSSAAIAKKPSEQQENVSVGKLSEMFQDHRLDIQYHSNPMELTDVPQIVDATLRNKALNAQSLYRDTKHNVSILVEYPVNVMNLNAEDGEFQICTGPVIVPDLATWDGQSIKRVFLAHVAISSFDHMELILQREIEAAEIEKQWLDKPRGRDRFELIDSDRIPPNYPPTRPRPTVFNEIWELEARNLVLSDRA